MTSIIGISGSLRRHSYNSALLEAAASLAPAGTVVVIRTIGDVPLYNNDIETAEGVPAPVKRLQDEIAAADALLICTPEYNNSMPGVLKNAVDWLSRPPGDIPRVFGGLPVAIMGASPGRFGTVLAQDAWLPVMHTLGTRFWHGGRLMIAGAGNTFNGNGALADDGVRERLKTFMHDFVRFAESAGRRV